MTDAAAPMTPSQPASLWRRLAAISYDSLIIGALLILATAVLLAFTKGEPISAGTIWYQSVLASIVLLYFSVSWWRSGQTIGMVAWRLRVQAEDGNKASFSQCVTRAIIAAVSWLVAGLGFLWVLVDRRDRGWHDLLSRTELRYEKRITAPVQGQQQ